MEPFRNGADRYNDTAPRNGGDQVLGNNGSDTIYRKVCTTGFGVQDASRTYLLTSGHCGNWKWFNTSQFAAAPPSSANLVGWTGTRSYANNAIDSELINGYGSHIVWTGSATRVDITGAVTQVSATPFATRAA